MPGRRYPAREEDPFRRINAWDDGYGYGYHGRDYAGQSRPPPRGGWDGADDAPPPVRRRHTEAPRRSRYPSPPCEPDDDDDDDNNDDYRPPRPRRRPARSPSPRGRRDPYYYSYDNYYRYDDDPPRDRYGARERSRARYSPSPPPRRSGRHASPSPSPVPGLSRSRTHPVHTAGVGGSSGCKISQRWQKAAVAALQAGGKAALNQRSKSGSWKGRKGARVATAVIGAAVGDVLRKEGRDESDRDRDRDRGRRKSGGFGLGGVARGEVEALGTALGGLLLEKLVKK